MVRSYRVVFRRRWRIYRIENWRLPLPGGLELRAIGYWLGCLVAILALGRLPVVSVAIASMPDSLRLGAIPMLGAWALSSWEVDGRPPHRALAGVAAWWLRPRSVAGLRACPSVGSVLVPLRRVVMAPDLYGCTYPRGRVVGPVRMLLRYPVRVAVEGAPRLAGGSRATRLSGAKCWRMCGTGGPPLHRGKTVEVPAGRVVVFEGAEESA